MNNIIYSFINDFNIEHGEIIISDPYFNRLSSLEDKIPLGNDTMLHVSLTSGIYNAFHQKDWQNNNIMALILLRQDFDIENIAVSSSQQYIGNVSTNLSSSVVIVEEEYIYKTKWLYNFMGENVIFDADRIISDIEKMPYPIGIKRKIVALCRKNKQMGRNVSGGALLEILQSIPIWTGFKNYDEDSTAWTEEIISRLYSSVTDAAIIKGGVVSRTESGAHSCYAIQIDNENVGLAVHLDSL